MKDLLTFFSNLQKQSNQAEGHWKLISCDWRIIVAKENLGTLQSAFTRRLLNPLINDIPISTHIR